MFHKKPRRNFRQRKGSSSDEEDEGKHSGNDKDNEKEAVFGSRPLKVPQSRGISCSSKREAPSTNSDSSEGDDEGEEEERQLTAERKLKYADKNKTNAMLSFSDEGGESDFKLKKTTDKAVLFQLRKKESSPAKTSQNSSTTITVGQHSSPQREDAGCKGSSQASSQSSSPLSHCDSSDDNNENDDNGDNGSSTDDKNEDKQPDSLSSFSSSGSSHRFSTKQVVIPSAKEIEAARRQRRANQANKNYIPLDKDGHSSACSTPEHFSKREEDKVAEDDDDELDDHERRIEFAPKPKSVRERIAEKLGGSDGCRSETDEEQELWEETQIEKGVKRRPGGQSPSGSESSSYSSSSRDQRQRLKKNIPALPSVSVSMIKKRITVKLDSLKELHRARQAEFRKIEGDIENARCSAETLEESFLEIQLKFYRDTTVYVHNLVECLREKIVEINSLELELHTLLSNQMGSVLSQRRQKVKEQADHLQQLSYKPDEHIASNANEKEILPEPVPSVKSGEDLPEDTQPSVEEEEQCRTQMEEILSRSQAVFSDVKDDFFDVKKILSRFEEWRQSYSDSYHNAYISLCLHKLLSPIIRHQLLAWNPLKDTSEDFENMPWFSALETFCHGHGHEELEHTDRQTLSNVIEKTLIPKLTAYVEMVWDPMSLHQTVCLTNVCHRLKDDYSIFEGEQSKPVKAFTDVVVSRLRSFVDEDIFIPIYPKRFLEDCSSPQCHFRDHQFWTAIKLLCIMGKWDLVLPESTLKELMLDKLLSRYLMIALYNSMHTLQACKKIAESLPSSWCREENTCLPQLQLFRNYLVQMVHSICKQQSIKEPSTRSAVVEVLQVLSCIRSYDSIMALAEKYHCEDAIYTHQLLNQDSV